MTVTETAQLLSDYADTLDTSSIDDLSRHIARMIRVTSNKLHGKSFQTLLQAVMSNSRFFGSKVMPYRTACMDVLAQASEHSEKLIKTTHPDFFTDPQFLNALQRLKKNTQHGRVEFLPEKFALDPAIGKSQVQFADSIFNLMNAKEASGIQRYAANLQYELFFVPGRTMHTGDVALKRIREVRSEKPGEHGNASHVLLSNAAHGQITESILERSQHPVRQIVIVGGGCGATLAGLVDPLNKKETSQRLNVVHIENSGLLAEEAAKFAQKAVSIWQNTGSRWALTTEPMVSATKNTLHMVEKGIVEALSDMEIDPELTVFIFNYVLHHMSTVEKKEIFSQIKTKRPNSIMLIGDHARNASESYRRYFGWTACATLNTGNLTLEKDMQDLGYSMNTPDGQRLTNYRHLHNAEEDRLLFVATLGDGTEALEEAVH